MRWIRFFTFIILLLTGVYALVSYYFLEETKSFVIQKNIQKPIDKVFYQFSDLQSFTRWNEYFDSENMSISYFYPYKGRDASLTFKDNNSPKKGDLFLRSEIENKFIRYHFFEDQNEFPSVIDVHFKSLSPEKTQIIWKVYLPPKKLMYRITNLWEKNKYVDQLDKSIKKLNQAIENKVEKDEFFTQIKMDSIFVEKNESQLLVGSNVNSNNQKDALFKNILNNYSKVINFVSIDLGKKDDEIGFPVFIASANSSKGKEISYFLGFPVSKRVEITDNNFSFHTVPPCESFCAFFKGNFANRFTIIQRLISKAKKENKNFKDVHLIFLEPPTLDKELLIKVVLPVFP